MLYTLYKAYKVYMLRSRRALVHEREQAVLLPVRRRKQRILLGASGSAAFGLFMATAIDCVLIDNSVRKLRSHPHCFVYLAHSRTVLANVFRLFALGFVLLCW